MFLKSFLNTKTGKCQFPVAFYFSLPRNIHHISTVLGKGFSFTFVRFYIYEQILSWQTLIARETSTFCEFPSIFFCMLLIMVGFLYLQCSFDFEFFLMKYLGLFTRIFTRIFFQKRKDLFSLIVAAVTIFDKYFRRIYHQ